MSAGRAFVRKYVLVYGRRDDLRQSDFGRRRAAVQQADETFMSWDRLSPSDHYTDLLSVRLTPRGYRAISIPPTLTLGPTTAEHHSLLLDRSEAIDACPYLSPTRKEFLKERWPYWDRWIADHERGRRGLIRVRDAE
jgi:hypothetical protein